MFKGEIIGHIGADAVMNGSDGVQFISFRVAHTERWRDASGNEQSSTQWVDVTLPKEKERLVPYLKQGQMVFVRGYISTRVYSSKKDRCMKAGVKIAAQEVEFCGGAPDGMPRRLIVPESGLLVNVTKLYWVDVDRKGMKKTDLRELIDEKGERFQMDAGGFVVPYPEYSGDNNSSAENNG